MPLIDDRGRVFGRINLIDASVGIVVLGLIPLAYGAFLLFRVPTPTITSVTPAQVVAHQAGTIQITGTDLRPFLRARLGTVPIAAFLIQSPTAAEIKLPDLPPGTYDLALADQGQDLVVKPGALTVIALPRPAPRQVDVQAVGAFTDLGEVGASTIAAGSTFGATPGAATPAPFAEVIAIRPPEPARVRVTTGLTSFITATAASAVHVPAILRLTCTVVNGDCKVGDTVVVPNTTLSLPWPLRGAGSEPARIVPLFFLIDEMRPFDPAAAFPTMATVRVRFTAGPEVLAVMKAGDVDVSGAVAEPDRAVLKDIGSDRQTITGQAGTEFLLWRSLQLSVPVVVFTATLRVPLSLTQSAWTYNRRPVKPGAAFAFETMAGAMVGWVLDVKLDQPAPNVSR